MQLVIISGRSGSGKSVALRALEDLGYYCIDNLPIDLLCALVENKKEDNQHIAISLDARNFPKNPAIFETVFDELHQLLPMVRIVYLDAHDSVLLKRYNETRRRHPLTSDRVSLSEAIAQEKGLLSPLAHIAHTVMDTTALSLSVLNQKLHHLFSFAEASRLQLLFMSFGYKHGNPPEADFVFDTRCLPNPYWDPQLRRKTGLDGAVIDFLSAQPRTQALMQDITQFLQRWIPVFEADNRCYLTIAIGCTGGQHRSVYMAEHLCKVFTENYPNIQIQHRDLPVKC